MKIQIWNLRVTEGVLAAVHGEFCDITECFIPDLNLALNEEACFLLQEGHDRYHLDKDDVTDFHQPPPELIRELETTEEEEHNLRELAQIIKKYRDACMSGQDWLSRTLQKK